MTEQLPTKEMAKQLRDNATVLLAPGTAIPTGAIAGALQMAADEIERLQRDAERWTFFRKHYMSSYQGKWLHVWLVDNVFRADGIDGAIDEVMAVCQKQVPR